MREIETDTKIHDMKNSPNFCIHRLYLDFSFKYDHENNRAVKKFCPAALYKISSHINYKTYVSYAVAKG